MVSTLDSESNNPSSSLGRTLILTLTFRYRIWGLHEVISEAWKATKSNTVCCTCSNHLTNFYFNGKGTARTQSPTTKNCAPELLAFGVIAKVSPDSVQCLGLTPDEQPVGSLLRLCQVSMKVSTSIEDLQWLSDTESLDLEIPSRFRLLVLPLQSNFWSHIPFFSWQIDIQVHLITLLNMIINLFNITFSSSTAIPRRTYPVSSAPGSQATSGPVSTWMGDRLGIPGAVGIFSIFNTFFITFLSP